MHKMLIVIGDDVDAQMGAHEEYDWWGIGGRYTGRLPLKPGRSGKTYGDAVPARVLDLPEGHVLHRSTIPGDGVDQAPAEDVDMSRVSAMALIRDGRLLLDAELSGKVSPDTVATSMAMGLMEMGFEGFDVSGEALVEALDEMNAWTALIQQQLAKVPGDTLLTLVDVHY